MVGFSALGMDVFYTKRGGAGNADLLTCAGMREESSALPLDERNVGEVSLKIFKNPLDFCGHDGKMWLAWFYDEFEGESMEKTSVGRHAAQLPEHGLFQIVYLSSATALLTRAELLDLLEKGRRRNAKIGITGLLLCKDVNMMHALEGKEETVKALYKKICRDRRHRRIIPLIQTPIQERQFPDWSMAFRDLDAADDRDIPGYSEFLNTPLTEKEFSSDLTRCQKLLLLFKRNMR